MKRPSITSAQMREARAFEAAGLMTISQAVKAFERREERRIDVWRKALAARQAE